MKSSPAARSWVAAGVRHELLTRALPALRHDMTGPVSVMRMGLLMLKRQLGAQAIDAAACAERLALVDSQVGSLTGVIRSLHEWELASDGTPIRRSAVVAQCVGLMRAPFDLQGIALEIDDSLLEADGEPLRLRSASLRYLVLGALCHLHDSVEGLTSICAASDGADAVQLRANVNGAPSSRPADFPQTLGPRALAVDAVALHSLADDLGFGIELTGGCVRLDFGPAQD